MIKTFLKMKGKFWIDIDDTILKVWIEEILLNYNKKFNKNLIFDDIKTHDFNWSKDLEKEFFDYFYKNHSKLKLFGWVKEKLEKLKKDYQLFLITSRPVEDIEMTKKYMSKIFWDDFFEEIIFTSEHNDDKKCELANKYWFDVVIDDASHHIKNYINNTKIKKIIIFDQPWNREIEEDNIRTLRIKSWRELVL